MSWLSQGQHFAAFVAAMSRTVEEQCPGLVVRCDALKKRERIADSVGRGSRQLRWIEERVNRDDLLNEGCHDPLRCVRLARSPR